MTGSTDLLPHSHPERPEPTFEELTALIEALSKTLALPTADQVAKLRASMDELLSDERKGRITGTLAAAGVINKRRKHRE